MAAVVVAAAAGCEESRRPGRSCGAAGRNQHPAAPAASRSPAAPRVGPGRLQARTRTGCGRSGPRRSGSRLTAGPRSDPSHYPSPVERGRRPAAAPTRLGGCIQGSILHTPPRARTRTKCTRTHGRGGGRGERERVGREMGREMAREGDDSGGAEDEEGGEKEGILNFDKLTN